MASTETGPAARPSDGEPGTVRPLGEADLDGCLALSLSANWNQSAADWRIMLALGRGWGIDAKAEDGSIRLAASTVVVPYAPVAPQRPGCAWVSMVLVLPEFQRRGFASQLLRHALAHLAVDRLVPVLDATPAGFPVYRREGFEPTWGFRRYRREALATGADESAAGAAQSATAASMAAAPGCRLRPLLASDWPAVMALDRPAFGGDREALLRHLAERLPGAARVAERDGRVVGYCLGRDGREASQAGPMHAPDDATALALLEEVLAAMPGAVYIDLADRHLALLPALVSRGFVLQRPFTRMVHGATEAPGDPARLVLMAGPELG